MKHLVIVFLLSLPLSLHANSSKDYSVNMKTISPFRFDVTFKLKDYKIYENIQNESRFSKIVLDGADYTEDEGEPELPFINIVFGIPSSGKFDVVVKSAEETQKKVPIIQPYELKVLGFEAARGLKTNTYYKTNAYFPQMIYESEELGFFRNRRIAVLRIYPFRYNPLQRTLKITRKITFEVTMHQGKNEQGIITPATKNSPQELMLRRLLINYDESRMWLKPHPSRGPQKPRQRGDIYKIATTEEGVYQITYTDLVDAGIDPAVIDPRKIHISNMGYEIPVYIKGEDDSVLNKNDYIDFFAERIRGTNTFYNPYTFSNIYWFYWGDSLGKRMVEEDGTPNDSLNAPNIPPFNETAHFEKDSIFVRLSNIASDSTDTWFWNRLYGPDSLALNLNIPSPDTLTNFNLSILMHGYTTAGIHRVNVYWNANFLGQFTWFGQKPYKIELPGISGAALINGDNVLKLEVPSPPDSVDGVFLNWVEVNFTHLLEANDNTLTFRTPENILDTTYEFSIDNFDFADVDIYKKNVSKIINLKKETYNETGKTKYRFIFQDRDLASSISFTALPVWEKLKPVSIEKVELIDLHSTSNTAQYLIITNSALKNSAGSYALWKESHGFHTMVVTTEEIYNDFNYGIAAPEAIRAFTKYAYDYYAEPPVYCLLFGDGTYDYKGLTGNYGNFVPVHLSWYWGLWGPVADDEYYARISGEDFIPDIFIGRFPIRTEYEFNAIFEKAKMYADYGNLDEWKKDVIFVADSGTAGYNSYPDMEQIITDYLPPAFDASRSYHPRQEREDFLREMDEGAVFVNFLSHGGGDVLCGGDFLISKDIYRITNLDRLPFWTAFSCVNGFFAEPNADSISIGETVFLAPNGGGIGYYGPGSLTYGGSNYNLSRKIFEGIFDKELLYFGQFLSYGEIEYYAGSHNKYQLMTYNFLGDPGLRLALPDTTQIDISIPTPSISTGDTLFVNGFVHGSPDGEAILTFYGTTDSAFKKVSTQVSQGNFSASAVTPNTLLPGEGIIKVYFRGAGEDGVGYEYYNIEQPNISNVKTIPKSPTRYDSVTVTARIYDPDGVAQAGLLWSLKGNPTWNEITMVRTSLDTFKTSSPVPPQSSNSTIEFTIYALDSLGNADTSHIYSYHIQALAELSFSNQNIYFDGDSIVTVNIDITNTGETSVDSFRVGFFTLNNPDLFKRGTVLLSGKFNPDTIGFTSLSLGAESETTARVAFNLQFDKYNIYAVVDPDNWVEEGDETNNSSINNPTALWVDHFPVTPDSGTHGYVQSADSVLYCSFPQNAVSQKTVLVLTPDSAKTPLLEPDIEPVPIGGDTLAAYNIFLSRDVLTDSFTLRFSLKDSLVGYPWFYLWLNDYNKWATIGKPTQDSAGYEKNTRNLGLYSIFYNQDSIPPFITSRVENSDYLNGTIYDRNVRISSVLTDKNGIDVVTRKVSLQLNSDTVSYSNYSYSLHPKDSRAIPLKFSKELEDGMYTLIIYAYDVNGNLGADTISFNVSIPFDISGIGNYPNPVYLDSTIFTYNLSRNTDEVTLKIFTAGARLIKQFHSSNVCEGYHEIVWHVDDMKKQTVANGVYFYRFIAKRKDEEKVKTFKMAILR